MDWLTGTTAGKMLYAFLISMVPVIELRVGLPLAIAKGLPLYLALPACILGNMVPVPFIIIFIKKIFAWLRRHWPWMDRVVTAMEKRADNKSDTVKKYGPWGLLIFAALMDMKLKQAVPIIFIGVCIAAAIMTAATLGVIHLF